MKEIQIYEEIGLTSEEADPLWDRDFVNELADFEDPGTVLKKIISDKKLSIEQKVYLTWIYAHTIEERKKFKDNQDNTF